MATLQLVTIRHWLPIVTICPVNALPDFIYVSVTFENEFVELYQVRKEIVKLVRGSIAFMEDIAQKVFEHFNQAKSVEVRLMFSRHVVTLTRKDS